MTKLRNIRSLFASHKLIRVMGAHNALGAKLVEKTVLFPTINTQQFNTLYKYKKQWQI